MSNRLDAFIKSIIFPRPRESSYDTTSHPHELVHIPLVDPATQAENGSFTCGYLFTQPKATHVLLYAHPNAIDIGMSYKELRHVAREACVNVLLFEYSGYGLSSTPITESSIHQDTLSAYLFVRRHLHIAANRIILCGRSIGASPVAFLAAALPPSEKPCLLILQCPFTALSECINEFSQNAVSIANFLGYNWFRTIDVIAAVECPVALHHGTHDTVVRIAHSEKLQQARDTASKPRVTYLYREDGKGHNNLSSAMLVRILAERVESEQAASLNLRIPKVLLANPPIYDQFFCDESGEPYAFLDEAIANWSSNFSLHRCAAPLDRLYSVLTASVCAFTMQCARSWQIYCGLVKRNACGDAVEERYSKEEFLRRCLACWGSPLGIHISVERFHRTQEIRLFGFATCRDALLDAPAFYSMQCTEPLLSVLEIAISPSLLSCMRRCLSTAPGMLDGDRIPCFVQCDAVEAIQLECERAVGFLAPEDRHRICALMKDFATNCETTISTKARERLLLTPAKYLGPGAESFEEIREWLRPWTSARATAIHALAQEVPWDDYLLRGRSLACRHTLNENMSWAECNRAMEESRVVLDIHCFFQELSTQCVRPSYCRPCNEAASE
ncbi:serine peptidase putativeserine peptidase Clan SC Family S9D [Leptomonas pyrrhocoris]|uniref:Serine peptidase putativeserine peptidase Clan SC Family S9D n=1 Tax=Leptomonas pyrrhocoris TaxID=157538 RepID=A0A0M9FTE5_LEPPY|nr:serine peptidase putativeserine peptidase Clan SC Family S9D [Leptomonas pyrrhocoris]KPA75653.1 serine peptidase putativeserine peptidase Clan SC Family S9D [Leptomonas pyrrhocoris]|eukprot:XP_015654092.1 serine peptidase putativeserine peptidase Clan SC Family S9D [Leptomonas pyrrhocoris]